MQFCTNDENKKNKYNYKNFKPEYYDMRNFYGPKAGDKYIVLICMV